MRALTVSTLSRFIWQFGASNIELLCEMGFETHAAANFKEELSANLDNGHANHHIDFSRNPFSPENFRAYIQLCRLLKRYDFDIIHCQTPVAALLTRLAAARSGVAPVIYMAHGFHFYEGAPRKNHLIYKTAEKIAARFSDAIITINTEDYAAARRFKMRRGGNVYKVPGVGIVFGEDSAPAADIRRELQIPEDAYIITSLGELNKNKNHIQVINAISQLRNKSKVHYIVCGIGPKEFELRKAAHRLGVNLHMPGFRRDALSILKSSDMFLFPSHREGLSKAMMEAMSMGLPIVATKIRGNVDLIENGVNGLLVDCENSRQTADAIAMLMENRQLAERFARENRARIEQYRLENVKALMREIYLEQLSKKLRRFAVQDNFVPQTGLGLSALTLEEST